jgi:hypothetical protein
MATVRERIAILDHLFADDELGRAAADVRDEAYSNLLFLAAIVAAGAKVNAPDARFLVDDRRYLLRYGRAPLLETADSSTLFQMGVMQRELLRQRETIEQLRQELSALRGPGSDHEADSISPDKARSLR